MAERERERFHRDVRGYLRALGRTQRELAHALGLHPDVLSHKLHGHGHAALTQAEVVAIVYALAAWGALATQAEARILLATMAVPPHALPPGAWTVPPLAALVPAAPEGTPVPAPGPVPESAPASPAASAPPVHPSSLPQALTPLIGRECAEVEVAHLLGRADGRLLTLTGPGGVGKTSLALQVAQSARAQYADDAAFVDLAPLREGRQVAVAIAGALGVSEQGGQPMRAALIAYLRPRQLLLLLDNAEHLLEAVAEEVVALRAACPELRLLLTSRLALHVRGEQVYPVPPLDLPDAESPASPATLNQVAAVALFVQRAREVRPDFTLSPENARAVAAVCRRLDGLPLALELAAARVGVLPPTALLARLEQSLALLVGGARDLPPRQRTLRDTIAWSYDLLDAATQALFQRQAVFAGGATLEALGALGLLADRPGTDLLSGVAMLVSHGLLEVDVGGHAGTDAPRYRLLETLREYAAERLAESGEAEEWHRRHVAYYLALGEQAVASWEAAPAERLAREEANVRAALDWSVRHQDAASALRLAAVLSDLCHLRGYPSEGRAPLAAALRMPAGAPALRAGVLQRAAMLAQATGDYATAQQLGQDSLALWQALGDRRRAAGVLSDLAVHAREQGDLPAARARLEEALALQRDEGDRVGQSFSLDRLGTLMQLQGDAAQARSYYQDALVLARAADYPGLCAWILHNLGRLDLEQGNLPAAHAALTESLALFRGVGDEVATLHGLAAWASLIAAEGQAVRALRLGGAVAAAGARLRTPIWPSERGSFVRWQEAARCGLSEEAAAAAWAEGQALTLEQVCAEALMADHSMERASISQ